MKFSAFVLFCLAWCVAVASAQTNTATNGVDSILALVTTNRPAAPAATNQPDPANQQREPVMISSAGPLIMDMINHWLTYSDNVHVTDGQMKMTCEWLKANFPANGEQVDQPTNIVAETNVVVDFVDTKGQKGRALGDKAVYQFQVLNGITNETVTLTGNPPKILQGVNYTNSLTGSKFVYDLRTKVWHVEQPSLIYWKTNSAAGSNSSGNDNLLFPK
jgi:lipopolysaccharide export system protein LptA